MSQLDEYGEALVKRIAHRAIQHERLRIVNAIQSMTGLTTDDIDFRERVLDLITAPTVGEPAGVVEPRARQGTPAGSPIAAASDNQAPAGSSSG